MKDTLKYLLRKTLSEKKDMSKAIEIQAPNELQKKDGYKTIFLAGSIEGNGAEEWQKKIVKELSDKPYIFFNPRRDDWDSSWTQEITNPQFRGQVEWELNALDKADHIIMYFDPKTESPISLLELGLHAKDNKLIVLCPEGFWKKGNVDVVCAKYNIKQVDSLDDLIDFLLTGKF